MEMIWVLLYAVLGLLAFVAPRDVHSAKSLLDALDSVSYALFCLQLLTCVFSLDATGSVEAVRAFLNDSLEGLVYYCIYLIFANISRYLWFKRISVGRILSYFIALMLLSLVLQIYP
ncbi:MAG: hypothetical protein LM590_17000 [Thermofilum sp.]|jgi:Ca2+/Na+ antiporter|nr:hypothetical protein [Thermofilum sp.]